MEAILAGETRKIRVLVVEDEPDMRLFLCNLLDACGLEPIVALSNTEGLEKARTNKPSVIILDAVLPDEGGIGLYRALKEDRRLKAVPVILLSTIDKKTFGHYCKCQNLKSGRRIPDPEGFVEKPVEADELLRIVKQLSGQRQDPLTP